MLLFENCGTHYVSDFIAVDTSKNYSVSFDALSVGKVPSKGYFMIDCYNEHQKSIMVQDCHVINHPAVTVTGISQDRKVLFISEEGTDWGLE